MVEQVPTVEEFTVTAKNWNVLNRNNALNLMAGSYTLHVRKEGKGKTAVFYRKVTRPVPVLEGDLETALTNLVQQAAGMFNPVIKTVNTAVGGGHGHYDYAVRSTITGWVVMDGVEVETMRNLQQEEKQQNKREREARKLEAQVRKLRRL